MVFLIGLQCHADGPKTYVHGIPVLDIGMQLTLTSIMMIFGTEHVVNSRVFGFLAENESMIHRPLWGVQNNEINQGHSIAQKLGKKCLSLELIPYIQKLVESQKKLGMLFSKLIPRLGSKIGSLGMVYAPFLKFTS